MSACAKHWMGSHRGDHTQASVVLRTSYKPPTLYLRLYAPTYVMLNVQQLTEARGHAAPCFSSAANDKGMASRGLWGAGAALVKSARVAAEPDRRREWHGDGQSPCHSPVAAACSVNLPQSPSISQAGARAAPTSDFIAAGAAKSVAGGKP
eukprot:1630811-Prymnesium_polylepis.1